MLIALLRVGGRPVAAQYLVCKDGEYYMILNDHDQRTMTRLTPGTNLLTLMLQRPSNAMESPLLLRRSTMLTRRRLATTPGRMTPSKYSIPG